MIYPTNIMVKFIEKMLTKDMHTSLINLKGVLEKNKNSVIQFKLIASA
jgi:hypothetical protein